MVSDAFGDLQLLEDDVQFFVKNYTRLGVLLPLPSQLSAMIQALLLPYIYFRSAIAFHDRLELTDALER